MAGYAAQSPRATVVTQTRNRPVLLTRVFRSVGAQSSQDLELVIVSDAGSTEAVDSAPASVPRRPRERTWVVTNETSRRHEAVLEDGLTVSSCELSAIHNDDDSWEPGFLTTCVAYLNEHSEHDAVATRCDVADRIVTDKGPTEHGRRVMTQDKKSWTLIDTIAANYASPILRLTRREVADRIGHWDGILLTQVDWDFNLRLLATSPVGFINGEPLAHWYHRDSIDGTIGNSVAVDAAHRRTDNLAIRDCYARLSVNCTETEPSPQGGTSTSENLRLLLASVEYHHRIQRRLEQQDKEIEHLKKAMYDLRFTISDLHDTMRQVLMYAYEINLKVDHVEAVAKPLSRTVAQGVEKMQGR